MEIKINSPKYGEKTVFIDDNDWELVKEYKWYIQKAKNGYFYAQHSWKRDGEEVTIKMHRVIMGVNNPKIKIDHSNTNTLDNTRVNLRVATSSQNSMNRGKTVKNKSGYKGVVYEPKKKLYRVIITANRVTYRGGRFKNIIDAAKKYDEMAKLHHGEFAYLNFK